MTDDPYQRYLSEFGERVEEAARAAAPRPHSRWPVAAAAVLAVALAGILLLGGPSGGDRINVVAEAKAALGASDSGEIIHLVTVSRSLLIGANEAVQHRFDEFAYSHWGEYRPTRFEQWSTDDRWRVATDQRTIGPKMFAGMPHYPGFYISDSELQRIGLAKDVTGPTQESYADGVDSLYVEDAGVVIRSHLADDSPTASLPGGIYTGSPTLLGGDPVDALRKALDSGNLRDAGMAEVDGRSVRRLMDNNGTFEYDVDAETFVPVRVRMFGHWAGAVDSPYPVQRMAEDVTFVTYETLPLEASTEHLVELNPPAGTTVVDAQGPHEQPPRSER